MVSTFREAFWNILFSYLVAVLDIVLYGSHEPYNTISSTEYYVHLLLMTIYCRFQIELVFWYYTTITGECKKKQKNNKKLLSVKDQPQQTISMEKHIFIIIIILSDMSE